jgi:hypothetical protein
VVAVWMPRVASLDSAPIGSQLGSIPALRSAVSFQTGAGWWIMHGARVGPVRYGGRPARRCRPYHEATEGEANLVHVETLIQERLARS